MNQVKAILHCVALVAAGFYFGWNGRPEWDRQMAKPTLEVVKPVDVFFGPDAPGRERDINHSLRTSPLPEPPVAAPTPELKPEPSPRRLLLRSR